MHNLPPISARKLWSFDFYQFFSSFYIGFWFPLTAVFFLLNTSFSHGQETVRDEFSSASYSNNNGTQNWSGSWVENDPYGTAGPSGNYVGISGARLFFYYSYVNAENIKRTANLSGASSATLTFDWQRVKLDNNESLRIQISSNGTTFTTLGSIAGSGGNGGTVSGNSSYDISAYISSTTTVRFINDQSDWEDDEYVYLDNVTITYTIPETDEAPSITASGNQQFCAGSIINIVQSVSITDPDDTHLDAAFIQITSNYDNSGDVLSLTGTHPNISASWDVSEGKLSLTGPATLAEFESAIAAVTFQSSASMTSGETRQFSIVLDEANYLASTGHYYEYISNIGITWSNAKTAAAARTFYGLQGYLATITSQAEADLLGEQASGAGWIGASDATTEGVWLWVTGPEAGTQFWSGGTTGSTTAPYNYANWNGGEPNNSGDEDYAHINAPGTGFDGSWNDLSNTGAASGDYQPKGYLVEYGGMAGDPAYPNISAVTSITVDTQGPTATNPTALNVFCASDIPAADVNVVTDEADNCSTPTVTYIGQVSDGGTNPEIITRTYRVTDASGNSTDVTQTITVTPFVVSTQPSNTTVIAGNDGTLSVNASNVNQYQWQVSTNNGTTYADITNGTQYSGAQTASLSIHTANTDMSGYLYKVVLSNSAGSCSPLETNAAILTVKVGAVITNRKITYRVKKN